MVDTPVALYKRAFCGVDVHAAFRWTARNFEDKIGTLFPNVKSLHMSPFCGMTDILLCKQHVAVIKVSETEIEVPVCCVEIGVGKPATCTISVDGVIRIWPKKIGELLASMHLFGAKCEGQSLWDACCSFHWLYASTHDR